ncbi:hypothetical protein KM043_014620 [Ampulex compressa]|nr:hypothetical protein KM043_014620 [Ampulex compressa]
MKFQSGDSRVGGRGRKEELELGLNYSPEGLKQAPAARRDSELSRGCNLAELETRERAANVVRTLVILKASNNPGTLTRVPRAPHSRPRSPLDNRKSRALQDGGSFRRWLTSNEGWKRERRRKKRRKREDEAA